MRIYKKTKKGVTLIELIVSISIVSIAFLSLINVFYMVSLKTKSSTDITVATMLAQGKLEEYLAKGDGASDIGWTTFDVQPGDEINYPSRFDKYSYQVVIDYVSKEVNPLVSKEAGTISDMKRVNVYVKKTEADGGVSIARSVTGFLKAEVR